MGMDGKVATGKVATTIVVILLCSAVVFMELIFTDSQNTNAPRAIRMTSSEAAITPLTQPKATSKADSSALKPLKLSTSPKGDSSGVHPLKPSKASKGDSDKTTKIISNTTSLQPLHETSKKYLVYLCDGSQMCAGWGDRQRFIVSVFFLAKVTGREFRLIMTRPCNIINFVVPNRYQWIPIGKELQSDSKITVDLWDAGRIAKFVDTFINEDFNVVYPQTVVYLKGNSIFHLDLEKSKLYAAAMKPWPNAHRAFRWAWTELMSPSPNILQKLKHVVGSDLLIRHGLINQDPQASPTKESHQFTCSHVRYGRNPSNQGDGTLTRYRKESIPELMKRMNDTDGTGNTRFYLATDAIAVRKRFQTYFGSRLLPPVGTITHVDVTHGESGCRGFGVALLEQYILSVCDHLLLTPSGFSFYAALVSNTTNPIYILGGEPMIRGPFVGRQFPVEGRGDFVKVEY